LVDDNLNAYYGSAFSAFFGWRMPRKLTGADTLHEKAPAIILCQSNIIASEAILKGHNDCPI